MRGTLKVAKQQEREVWGANQLQDIIYRNTAWMQEFIVAAVKALRKDGRPIFTAAVPEKERLARLLEAGPEFWDALKQNDPEAAAKLAADIIRARAAGKVPAEGPRVGEAQQIEDQQTAETQGTAPPTGTQVARPIAPSLVRGAQESVQ